MSGTWPEADARAAVRQLGYLGLGVRDQDAWHDFATSVLGLQPAGITGLGTALYRMDELRARLHVHATGEEDVTFLGWLVRDEEELAALEGRLRDAGLPARRGTAEERAERGVYGLVITGDPGGLVNEIGYGPVTLMDEPFTPGRPMDGPFVAGPLGLGHIVLMGGDPDANMRFYRDLLGLRITDIVAPPGRMPAAFLRANPRHHSVAFPLVTVPDSGRRIQHFLVEAAELDDVGRAQDLAERRGELEVRLGRHGNDRMLSCYLRSPSGFFVEYGWGAAEVTEDAPVVQHARGDIWGHQPASADSEFASQFSRARSTHI